MRKSSNMVVSWGWKDFVAALMRYDWADNENAMLLAKLVIAVSLVLGVGLLETFCNGQLKKAKTDGPCQETKTNLWTRMLTNVLNERLAVGYALNQVARDPLSRISQGA